REMDTEKRVPQIGHRVNVGPESACRFVGVEIESFERKNPIFLRESEVECDLVGIEAGSIHDVTRFEHTAARAHAATVRFDVCRSETNVDPFALRVLVHRLDYEQRVHRRRTRRKQRSLVRLDPGLDPARVRRAELLDGDAVRAPASEQLVERREIGGILRDDELAAPIERYGLLLAIRREPLVAQAGELGLQAVGRVVEPGVQHAAVPAAAVHAAGGFLLDEHDTSGRLAASQFARDRQPDDAAANDEKIAGLHEPLPSAGAAFSTIYGVSVEDGLNRTTRTSRRYRTCFDATFE